MGAVVSQCLLSSDVFFLSGAVADEGKCVVFEKFVVHNTGFDNFHG